MRPDLIVLHYTGMKDAASARQRLCDPDAHVSAHWLLDEHGNAEALVPEPLRAWHAGAGSWNGLDDINSRSIGIEIVNTGAQPFPEPQMAALTILISGIMQRWAILPVGVIAHSDMAPGRKVDPGPKFDWKRLALDGLCLWPSSSGNPDIAISDSLDLIGYPPATAEPRLQAFRLRWCPWHQGSETAQDRAIADAVAQEYRNARAFT